MKKLMSIFFNFMEKMYRLKNDWKIIPDSETNYVYVDILKHKGRMVELIDGTIIKKGDKVAEVHVNNRKMVELNARTVLGAFASEMKLLAKAMEKNEEFTEIKALFGRTVLYPIPQRIGFEVFEMDKSLFRIFIKVWGSLIKLVFSSSKRGKTIMKEPKEIWISKERLVDKMGR